VTTRASLGHTGRPLVVSRITATSYLVFTTAVLVRVLGPSVNISYYATVAAAGALWAFAFVLYLIVYAPILVLPRIDGRPG